MILCENEGGKFIANNDMVGCWIGRVSFSLSTAGVRRNNMNALKRDTMNTSSIVVLLVHVLQEYEYHSKVQYS